MTADPAFWLYLEEDEARYMAEEEQCVKYVLAEIDREAMEQASDNVNFNNTSCFSVCQARLFSTVSGPCVRLGSSC